MKLIRKEFFQTFSSEALWRSKNSFFLENVFRFLFARNRKSLSLEFPFMFGSFALPNALANVISLVMSREVLLSQKKQQRHVEKTLSKPTRRKGKSWSHQERKISTQKKQEEETEWKWKENKSQVVFLSFETSFCSHFNLRRIFSLKFSLQSSSCPRKTSSALGMSRTCRKKMCLGVLMGTFFFSLSLARGTLETEENQAWESLKWT